MSLAWKTWTRSYITLVKIKWLYMSYWQNTLHHSQKLEFFRSFKSDHTTSNYLHLTRGTAEIKKLVKLRISKHKLMIELGRYNQITRDNRNCPFCGSSQIEDEFTFFLIVQNTLSLGIIFTIKLRFRFQILPSSLWTFWPINWWSNTSNYYINIRTQI